MTIYNMLIGAVLFLAGAIYFFYAYEITLRARYKTMLYVNIVAAGFCSGIALFLAVN